MKTALVCFALIISLLLPPIAHAAGLDYCNDTVCASTDQNTKENQDNGTAGKASFHCCASHVVAYGSEAVTTQGIIVSLALHVNEPEDMASLSIPPLLEPPSHI